MRIGYWPLGLVGVGLVYAWASTGSTDTITPSDFASRTGQTITVTGKISEVFTDPRSGTTFLDMGGFYPDNRFAAVIFPDESGAVADPQAFSGRKVAVTGTIRLYHGRPEIVISSSGQLKAE